MTTNDYDYSQFKDHPTSANAGDNSLHALSALAEEQIAAELKVEQLKKELAEAEADLKTIKTERFPALLDELDMTSFSLSSGQVVKIKEKFVASANKADTDRVHQWVEDEGNGDLIKREFNIVFPKEEEKWAAKFWRDLQQRKKPLDVTVKRSIHPATFNKYIENKITEGKTPPDCVHIIRHRSTEITDK